MPSSNTLRRKLTRRSFKNRIAWDALGPRLRPLRIEQLEARRLLSVNPFASYANDLETKLVAIQSTLDTTLDTVASLKSLPFIGKQLGKADQVKTEVDQVGNQIQSVLTAFSTNSVQASDLQNEIYQALGPSGLNLLGGGNDGPNSASTASDIHVSNFTTFGSGLLRTANVEMRLHENATLGNPSDLSFTLGLPSMPVQVKSQGGIVLTVGFDFELAINFNATLGNPISIDGTKTVNDFSPTLSAHQLVFPVSATLSNNASLTADLGLLTGTLVATPSQPNSLSAEVTVDGLSLSGSPSVAYSGSADVNLTATLGLGDGGADFPSVSTDLTMSWPDLTQASTLSFSYDNLALNLGQFLSNFVGPIVHQIQQYTQPLQSLINFLNTPIPGIDQLPGLGSFSLLTLLSDLGDSSGFGSVAHMLTTVSTLVSDINSLSIGPNVSLPLGSFSFTGTMIAGPVVPADASDLTNVLNLLGNSPLSSITTADLTAAAQSAMNAFNLNSAVAPLGLSGSATQAVNDLQSNFSIAFPFLEHPSSLLDVLFGQDVTLVTASGSIGFSGGPYQIFSASIPIFWPFSVNVSMSAGFSAGAALAVGYDTYGVREALAQLQSGSPSPSQLASDIGDGFYVSQTGTNLSFSAYTNLFAGVGISVGFAGAAIGLNGGVQANVTIGLNPNAATNGKIRLLELEQELSAGNLFDVSGSITAGLSLAFNWYINYFFGHAGGTDIIYNFGSTTLWSFASASNNNAPPVVAGVSPAIGPTAGGALVFIYGTNLNGATSVLFGGVSAAIDIDTAGYIEVTTPVGSAGLVNVKVTTGGGSTTDSGAYTYISPPAVTAIATGAFTPPGGPETGGAVVTITGVNLQNATAVDFAGFGPGGILSDSANSITVSSPTGSGAVDITVVTPGGTSATSPADVFTYMPPPIITSIVADSGPQTGGTVISIYGSNLQNATLVSFNFAAAFRPQFYLDTSTEIRVRVPAAFNYGTVDVQVLTAGGFSAISQPADQFTYIPPPVINYLAPNTGPMGGKSGIQITGYHLGGATAVSFNLQAGTIDALYEIEPSADLWTMIATAPPAYMYGISQVQVTTPGGTSSTASWNNPYYDDYFYAAAPSVITVSPAAGPLAGGTSVLITGTNLAGTQAVEFGNVLATSFSYNPVNGTITAVSPAEVAGTVTVTVITAGGSTTPAGFDSFTYTAAPTVTAVAASSGAFEGGTLVTISGTDFSGATAVKFGGVPATNVTVVSNTQITATTPAGTGTVDATVTTPYGTSATLPADQYTYNSVPVVTAVSPLTGPLAGGTTVTIAGLNFLGATDVYFGAIDVTAGNFTVNLGGTLITLTTLPSVAGTVDVTVTGPNGTSATSAADRFLYGTAPLVAGLAPLSGPIAGGTVVTISGANFTGATDAYFGAVDVPLTPVMINPNGTTITVASPAGTAGTVDVTVVSPNGTSTLSPADQFTYFSLPTVSVMYPDRGPVGGSTYVSITGSGLANATAVNFGSHAATIISDTDTQLIVLSPASTGNNPGTAGVTVTTAHGTSAAQTFTYIVPPAVTSIFATSGPETGGTTVAITGTNLSGVAAVYFGGIPASFSINHNQIIAISPPGDLSIVDVQVVTGGGMSIASPADWFTYLYVRRPIVVSISSTLASLAGGSQFVISGSNLGNATAVNFGSLSATIVSDTDNQIVVDSPSSAALNTVDVTVVSAGGTSEVSADDQVTFVAPPTFTSMNISSGFRSGGDLVTIYGTNLDSATEVDFGANAGVIVDETSDAIDVYSPAGDPGTVPVTVVTPGGTAGGSKGPQFTYLTPPPDVLGLSESVGPAAGGTTVTITGDNLDGATEVDFGTVPATIVSDTATALTIYVPPVTGGEGGSASGGAIVDVTVTTPGGTSATSVLDQFTFIAPPVVSSVAGQASQSGGSAGNSLAAGPVSGGTQVLIVGTGLAGATAVDFGTLPGTILVAADTYITVLSPAAAAGTVDVTVTTPYGTSAVSPPADQFAFVAAPSAQDASYTTTADTPLTVPAPGVLANDTDPQGLPLTAILVTDPSNGMLTFNGDGSFTYTPNSGYIGPDSFTYEATNGYISSSTKSVSIAVNSGTMTWVGGPGGTGGTGSTGDWTDPQQWSGADLPYPDATVGAIVDTSSVVNVTSNQAAYALAISQGGEVSVGPGAVLSVATNFSISSGGALVVDPNGAFYAGQSFLLDSGAVTGGSVSAGSYQLNDGAVTSNLGGSGGVTVGGGTGGSGSHQDSGTPSPGIVTLSGTNTYAGGTVVYAGTLAIDSAGALPNGGSLTVGDGASSLFGRSQTASNSLAAGPVVFVADAAATPVVTAGAPVLSALSSSPKGQVGNQFTLPTAVSARSISATNAIFAWQQTAHDQTISSAERLPSARPWAWLAAVESSWHATEQNKATDSALAAVDKILAQYGV